MDDERATQAYERSNDPSRVLTLSDGVFAIILTLLVLEIHVPDLTRGQTLVDALEELRPSFVAFLLSFMVVAIAWAGHRDLFSVVRRTDRTLVWLNLLYLLPVSVIPFGASLLAQYDRDPVALRLYGAILVAIALTRLVAWWYTTGRTRLLFAPMDAPSRRVGTVIVAVPIVVYAAAVAIAESAPTVTLLIYFGVPVLYFIAIAIVRGTAAPESADREFT